jgi:hypothetical protein
LPFMIAKSSPGDSVGQTTRSRRWFRFGMRTMVAHARLMILE